MKTAPAPWIHTGLNIHPRLSRFLKKWGFTRDSIQEEEDVSVTFSAIIQGAGFTARFWKRDRFILITVTEENGGPVFPLKQYSRDSSFQNFVNGKLFVMLPESQW